MLCLTRVCFEAKMGRIEMAGKYCTVVVMNSTDLLWKNMRRRGLLAMTPFVPALVGDILPFEGVPSEVFTCE